MSICKNYATAVKKSLLNRAYDFIDAKVESKVRRLRIKIIDFILNNMYDGELLALTCTYGKLLNILIEHVGETGLSEGAVDVLKRLIIERDTYKNIVSNYQWWWTYSYPKVGDNTKQPYVEPYPPIIEPFDPPVQYPHDLYSPYPYRPFTPWYTCNNKVDSNKDDSKK